MISMKRMLLQYLNQMNPEKSVDGLKRTKRQAQNTSYYQFTGTIYSAIRLWFVTYPIQHSFSHLAKHGIA